MTSPFRQRPFTQAYLAVLAGALLLVGCGGNDAPAPPPGEPEIMADGGQVLRKGNSAEPESLDPHRAQSVGSSNVLRDLYEGLVSEAPDGSLIPGAAERWAISEDGRTYTFFMRPNARWSNGDPVTAEDFAWSLQRAVDPATASSYAEILAPIENAKAIITGEKPPESLGAKAIDSDTLQIRLNAPTPYFLGMLTHSMAYPVHRSSVLEHGDNFPKPGNNISNGAYVIKEWQVSAHILLQRNPQYWDNANTRIEYVKLLPIDNAESEHKRYLAGELDWTGGIPQSRLAWAKKQLPNDYRQHPYLGVYYYGLNVTREPFKNNPKLRRALSLAIDRDILVTKATRGGEIPAWNWVPPGVNNYVGQVPEIASQSREQQINEAKRLYQEAGYGENNHPIVTIRYNTSEGHKDIATTIGSFWKSVLGVKVELVNEEWKVFLRNVKEKKKTQAYRSGWIGDYNDANTFLELMGSGFGLNGTGYNNPVYDQLLKSAALEADPAKRRQLLQRAEQVLLEDQPVIPIYFYVKKSLVKPWVKGMVGNVMDHHYSKNLWIEVEAQP